MKRTRTIRRLNYGQGDLFNFHGAFTEKKDALAKERTVPGGFIKTVWYRGGPRYGVLTRNPKHNGQTVNLPLLKAVLAKFYPSKQPERLPKEQLRDAMRYTQKLQKKRNPLGILGALDALGNLSTVKSLLGGRKRRKLLKKHKRKNVEWGTYEKGIFHPWTRRPKTRKKKAQRRLNSDTDHFRKALHTLYPGKAIANLSTAQLSQVLRAAQDLKSGKPISKRGNPSKRNYADATELYTRFHGRGPKGVRDTGLPVKDFDGHDELAQLGRLASLTIGGKGWRKKIEWGTREAPALASETNGKQLYIVGGSQNLDAVLPDIPALTTSAKSRIRLGECYQLEYFTQKGFDNFQPVTYYHELGEETGERPDVVYDKRKKRIHLVKGAYTVKPEGIVN